MKSFEELKEAVAEAEADVVKCFEKGNISAGKRLRKKMMEIRRLTYTIRDEVQAKKNEDIQ